ncbi:MULTISPECIES: hypothetical protein [unclassified Paraburkholderia]|uniref:hypothetical protein n=1 Tax=unclassified Paraburkholderia TaxID=2615204 RepID=UPI002AB2654C|nr:MULTISPECIES: hypothetical protein [unclassified Paraburkholderia]
MKVAELIANERRAINGSRLRLEGVFVMINKVGYFVSDMDAIDDMRNAILLEHENLMKHLFSSVPAYGGGKYVYCDRAEISGVFERLNESIFFGVMRKIVDFVIYKYENPMIVRL